MFFLMASYAIAADTVSRLPQCLTCGRKISRVPVAKTTAHGFQSLLADACQFAKPRYGCRPAAIVSVAVSSDASA